MSEQIKKMLRLLTVVGSVALLSFAADSAILKDILQKLKRYHNNWPQEKLYLHLDKPFYAAGDNLWFKAYLLEATLHHLDSQSSVVYVDLIDANRAVFRHQVLYAPDGLTFGDFQLPDTLSEGRYVIRAYTNYMKNFGESFFFTKEFSVLNPLRPYRALTQSFERDSIDLQFFPEGGNFVAVGFNRLAFKATGPDGKGFNVEGEIVDESNHVITVFKSQHFGMGVVNISPAQGARYSARITKPYPVNRVYRLPDVLDSGYRLQVDATESSMKVIVTSSGKKAHKNEINLIVQSRGLAYYAQRGVLRDDRFFTLIPKSKFPDGISQITVFDELGRPVAERLVYQNHTETIDVKAKTDTGAYGKRKMVTVLVDAAYQNGSPAAGHFSISVYDDALMTQPEAYPVSIVNYLRLSSDLKGYIEDPGYYFKDTLQETKRNLDLLMMVNGWRRFTWTDILSDAQVPLRFAHEKGIPISGSVLRMAGKRPPVGSVIKILTLSGNAVKLNADSSGRFYTDELLFYDSMKLVFQTENQKGKKQPYKFWLDPVSAPPAFGGDFTSFIPFKASSFLQQSAEEKLVEKSTQVKVLDEAQVVAKRNEPDPRLINPGGPGGRVVDVKNQLDGGLGYASVSQMLFARVAGLNFIDGGWTIRNQPVVFAVNNILVTDDYANLISPRDIDLIEVLFNSVRHGGQHVISIILRQGAVVDTEPVGINQATLKGFYEAREFYSPNYDVHDNRHNFEDKRTTLFWEPMVITDESGRAAVAFFTADVASRYRVVIEGITPDGYPGTATCTFEVK